MKKLNRLQDLYSELGCSNPCKLFVAPPIRFAYKKSDYLYLLYKDLITSSEFKITGVSTLGHIKFLAHQVIRKKSVLHYHWIECTGFLSIPFYLFKLICIQIYVLLGGKLIWSVHNKMPLDCSFEWINYIGRKWLAKKAHLLLIECEAIGSDTSTFLKVSETKMRVWLHPKYPPQLMPRAAAVEAINHRYNVNLKVQDRLFLMFGHISAYKQIDKVCEIFQDEPIQKKLIIVGPVKKGQIKLYKKIRKLARSTDNIVLIPQFIREECVPEFMNAADYLVFNYKNVLSSGGVPLAQSYNKPIILPLKGCLRELENSENLRHFKTQEELKIIIKNS
ncbi:MAG: hypothetical protein EA391_07530 [Balneolaceae bacterium]|nr:MAG: hypothetical protein EA391_07530 [Balneolaceae bacterium]